MPRRLFKSGIATALHWSGVTRLFGVRADVRETPLVVAYHRVVEDFDASAAHSIASMLISVRTFERQLDWLGRRFEFVSLDQISARLERGIRFRRPVAAVTFDDGYADVYHHALPILERKGIPAAIFVVTDLVDTDRLQLHDELYLLLSRACATRRGPGSTLTRVLDQAGISPAVASRIGAAASGPYRGTRALLERLAHDDAIAVAAALRAELGIPEPARRELASVTWEMLREMDRADVQVGSHSRTHAWLTAESPERTRDEVVGSRRDLERGLGAPAMHFAYPDGRFDRQAVDAVAGAGYRSAYTTCWHRDPVYSRLTVPRRPMWESSCLDALGRFSPSMMSCQVSGAFDIFGRCTQNHRT